MGPRRGRQPPAPRAPLVPGDGPLARARPVVVFLVVLAVFTAGVLLGGFVGAALLGALAAAVGLLLATTWQRLSLSDRMLRLLVLLVLVVLAINVAR